MIRLMGRFDIAHPIFQLVFIRLSVGASFFRRRLRSSAGDSCMQYCVSLDGHCDCVDAQQEIKAGAGR